MQLNHLLPIGVRVYKHSEVPRICRLMQAVLLGATWGVPGGTVLNTGIPGERRR